MYNIGIFGGGQLAKMIMLEGYKMGYTFNVYDPNENACSSPLANEMFNYSFLDKDRIDDFFNINDVFTYEFENVNPDFLKLHKDKIPQGVKALQLLQDRYLEKEFINSLEGVKTVPFSLGSDIKKIKFPCIIKTRRNGYDGKGQYLATNIDEIENIIDDNYIVEDFIDGIIEYSIVLGRSKDGNIYCYEPINNIHKKGILYQSTFAKNIDEDIKEKMTFKANEIISNLDYYGVLCVEFFVKGKDVYVNEVAPRVHNSGHLTIEGSNISQFKLHLHCILGLNVPNIKCFDNFYMINILGHDMKNLENMIKDSKFKNITYHIYGKNSYDKNRKVGHITFENDNGLLGEIKKEIIGGIN